MNVRPDLRFDLMFMFVWLVAFGSVIIYVDASILVALIQALRAR